jgi:integrase/recombinase XerD
MKLDALIDDHLAALAAERGLSVNTTGAYRRDLGQYRAHLETAGVEDAGRITANHVTDFVAALRKRGLAPSTIARKVAAVRGLHRYAVDENLLESDPTVLVASPSRPAALPKALTVDRVLAMLDAPDRTTPLGARDAALLEVMYATGCRVAEAIGLMTGDLDLETSSALVTGKGNRQRLVLMGGHAVDAVRSYLPIRLELKGDRPDPGVLFLSVRGRPLTRQAVWQIVKRNARAAGIPEESVSPHVLRHSAATHMVEGGADLRVVQEMLGHATIGTTQMYTRVTPDHLYEVYVTSHPRGV